MNENFNENNELAEAAVEATDAVEEAATEATDAVEETAVEASEAVEEAADAVNGAADGAADGAIFTAGEPSFTGGESFQAPPVPAQKENTVAGIVGAFLFALAGGIIYFLLYQIGIFAALSGTVAVICAIKGYSVFGKGESIKGVIISTVIAFLVIVAAWYLCLSYDVYTVYGEWFELGEIDFQITFFEAVRGSHIYLFGPDMIPAYWLDLGLGLLFCVLGAFSPVKNALAKAKANQ